MNYKLATIVAQKPKEGQQSGRYQLQFVQAQDSGTTNPEQTSEAVYPKKDAPFYGIGKTGADFINGQTVYVQIDEGGQEPVIVGALPNAIDNDKKGDVTQNASWATGLSQWLSRVGTDPKTLSKTYKETFSSILGNVNTFQDLKPNNVIKLRSELEGAIKRATRSGKDPIEDIKGTVRAALEGGIEKGRYAAIGKNINKSIGSFAFKKSDMKDPVKYIQNTLGKKGELIPNAMQMIQNLKATVKSGSPTSMISSVGGSELINKALAGINMIRSERANNEVDLMDYLCELYEELFPGLECKINNEFTPGFLKWKKEYLLALRTEQGLI